MNQITRISTFYLLVGCLLYSWNGQSEALKSQLNQLSSGNDCTTMCCLDTVQNQKKSSQKAIAARSTIVERIANVIAHLSLVEIIFEALQSFSPIRGPPSS